MKIRKVLIEFSVKPKWCLCCVMIFDMAIVALKKNAFLISINTKLGLKSHFVQFCHSGMSKPCSLTMQPCNIVVLLSMG